MYPSIASRHSFKPVDPTSIAAQWKGNAQKRGPIKRFTVAIRHPHPPKPLDRIQFPKLILQPFNPHLMDVYSNYSGARLHELYEIPQDIPEIFEVTEEMFYEDVVEDEGEFSIPSRYLSLSDLGSLSDFDEYEMMDTSTSKCEDIAENLAIDEPAMSEEPAASTATVHDDEQPHVLEEFNAEDEVSADEDLKERTPSDSGCSSEAERSSSSCHSVVYPFDSVSQVIVNGQELCGSNCKVFDIPIGEEVQWVSCDRCEKWLHCICTRIRRNCKYDEEMEYVCDACKRKDRKTSFAFV